MGPSGAGKTTLLNCLTGVGKITGEVRTAAFDGSVLLLLIFQLFLPVSPFVTLSPAPLPRFLFYAFAFTCALWGLR
jgi:energy-coupling factor transporter ATP-binding protein EcfA2